MHQIITLARKEFRSYFDSPVAYVVISLFLLIAGWQFSTALFLNNSADLRNLFSIVRLSQQDRDRAGPAGGNAQRGHEGGDAGSVVRVLFQSLTFLHKNRVGDTA